MPSTSTSTLPAGVKAGLVLYDHSRQEHVVIRVIGSTGVILQRGDGQMYLSHALFREWYGSRLSPSDTYPD